MLVQASLSLFLIFLGLNPLAPMHCATYHSRDTRSYQRHLFGGGLFCWTATFPRAQSESGSRLPTGTCAEPVVTPGLPDGPEVCLHSPVPWDLLVSVFSCLSAHIEGSDFLSVVPKPVSPTSLGNWLEMHTRRPHARIRHFVDGAQPPVC